MIIFGLTGGICSGKSTVTKTFRKHNIPIVDADVIARQVVEVGTSGYFHLRNVFGDDFFLEDGSLNRPKLGELVFAEKSAMDKLNRIMGPRIQDESSAQINRWGLYLKDNNRPLIIGYDAALVIEMGNAKKYRPLIVVRCLPEQQIERLMKRGTGHGPLTREQAMVRINAQLPAEEKVKLADYVIDTSKDIEYSIVQTEEIIRQLKVKENGQT